LSERIAIFVHQPKCSIESANGIIKALEPHYRFKIFTKWKLDRDFFDDVDMIAVPGGIGDSDSHERLFLENGPKIKQFLKDGGRYLGICMGAYWADKYYFDLLHDIRAVQYITRPNTCTRRPHAKAMPVNWRGQQEKMYFYDGCALVGNGQKEVWATYSNGDPMAIIQDRIGLIGCHPESEPAWYSEYHSWMKPHWHDGKHHELLLNFVDALMAK
jgi:glutamine amidotransferase-like uncharacterized protein